MSDRSNVVRTAGLLERYHIHRIALGLDTAVVVAARYVSSQGETLTPAILYPALHRLIQSDANLCVRVAYTRSPFKKQKWIRLSSVNLDKVVEFKHEPVPLQDALEQQTSYGFDMSSTERPLWRLTVLPDNTAVFAYHHAIGDGMSGRAFHISLLAALRATSSQSKETPDADAIVQVPPTITMVPPIEKKVKVKASLKQVFLDVILHDTPASTWTANPVIPSIPSAERPKNHIRLFSFPSADVKAIISTCRAHKATLTGALRGVAADALSRVLSDPQLQPQPAPYNLVPIGIPMSLRPLTNVPDTVLCDHVSMYTADTPLPALPIPDPHAPFAPDDAFWSAAAALSATLRGYRQTSLSSVAIVRFAPLVGGLRAYFKGKLGKRRENGMGLINLGAWPKPSEDGNGEEGWKVAETAFTQEDTIVNEPLKINVSGGGDGSLTITVNWGEGALESAFAEAFVERLREGLMVLAEAKTG